MPGITRFDISMVHGTALVSIGKTIDPQLPLSTLVYMGTGRPEFLKCCEHHKLEA